MDTPRIAYVDGSRLRRTLVAACEHAQRQRSELNRINVFPVPDGDTGTNLALTVRTIADHLRPIRDRDIGSVAREAADAAVVGARGNCGMMLSHFLIGFADAVGGRFRIAVPEFRQALRCGVTHLQDALERPVEGTILTVMRESADAAVESEERDFVPLVEHVVARAREALERTPDLLPVLKSAGVVDAGAKGFVSLLEGALLFIHGDPLVTVGADGGTDAEDRPAVADVAYPERTNGHRFCTEALVRGPELPSETVVREGLRARGDSLIAIRSGDLLKVHIHTDQPEGVFAWLRGVGTLVTHKAEDMETQHAAIEESAGHVALARRPVSVVTDSAADLPEVVVRAHGIHVTPLLLVDEDESLRDGVDITADEFHALLDGDPDALPTTSQPAPADFLETFRKAAEEGKEILAVLLGSGLSGTFAAAEAAASRFESTPVHLVDSRGASLLVGLLALKGAELVEGGTTPAEAARELRRVRDRSGILFTVDRFDRLLASGRVGRGRAFLGNVLNVKPILGLDEDGQVVPVERVLGHRRLAPAVLDLLEERIPGDVRRLRFGIVHVAAPDVVSDIAAMLRKRWGRDVEILTAPATPVLATHLGAGAWGVAWMVED